MGLAEKLALDGERKRVEEELKKEKLPLFIWGSGNVAELVRKHLKFYEIQEAGFFEWPTVYHDMFHGNQVYSLEAVEQYHSRYNVIVGHSHYSMAAKLLKYAHNINRVFYLFSFDYCGDNCNTFFDCNLVKEHMEHFEMLYRNLCDRKSRENLAAFLNTKMTGNVQYIFEVFEKEMTFFENDIYDLTGTECYWNIGGGKGETISDFLQSTYNQFQQVVTLEPDSESYCFLRKYIDAQTFGNKVFAYSGAAWDKQERISFSRDDDVVESGGIDLGNTQKTIWVEGIQLDELFFNNEQILAPTLITANYFHGIIQMLKGARHILKKFFPRLAIVVGHNDEYGIVRVAQAIWKANPEYKLYLRFHQALATTLVLYAVKDDKRS